MGEPFIDIKVDWDELEKAARAVSGLTDLMMQEVGNGLKELALEVEREAKERLKSTGAVDLGRLWNSITVVPLSETEVVVGTNVSYAAAVEFGTKGHWLHIDSVPGFRKWMERHGIDKEHKLQFFYVHPKARPYMEPAYRYGKDQVGPIIQEKINRVMERLKSL